MDSTRAGKLGREQTGNPTAANQQNKRILNALGLGNIPVQDGRTVPSNLGAAMVSPDQAAKLLQWLGALIWALEVGH